MIAAIGLPSPGECVAAAVRACQCVGLNWPPGSADLSPAGHSCYTAQRKSRDCSDHFSLDFLRYEHRTVAVSPRSSSGSRLMSLPLSAGGAPLFRRLVRAKAEWKSLLTSRTRNGGSMARDGNTFEKMQRERLKKQKSEDKRARRQRKKQRAEASAVPAGVPPAEREEP